MKIVVIGCTHAGTAAILNSKELYPNAEIVVFERNDNISFLSCGIALHVGGVVRDVSNLFYSSPEKLKELGVITKMKHDVLNADLRTKTLKVKDLITGHVFSEHYDKLIITTGSWPVIPPIKGVENENILLCKNYDHAQRIVKESQDKQKITIIGAGYIGVELVEAFEMMGKEATLIDSSDRVLPKYFDPQFTNIIEDDLKKQGIKLALGQTVQEFVEKDGKVTAVVTDQESIEADLVVLCVGFKPNTELFKGQLEMLKDGSIIVDKYMHTSQDDVVAAGDCCSVYFNPEEKNRYIPLATNAVRMGTLAARNLIKKKIKHPGTQGTSGIKIYDKNYAATGLTAYAADLAGIEFAITDITENHRPEFMPDFAEVKLRLVYEKNTRVILGAQLVSTLDLTQSINTISMCIQNKLTIEELAFTDFFFQPHYNKPWNFINAVALKALK